jgi:hypothetical protein
MATTSPTAAQTATLSSKLTSGAWLVWKSATSGPQIVLSNSKPSGYAYATQLAQSGQTVQDALNAFFSALAGAPSQYNSSATGQTITNPWGLPLSVGPNGGIIGTLQQTTGTAQSAVVGILSGLSDWQQLAVRALEALAGFALIILGLQALTGTGNQGKPI